MKTSYPVSGRFRQEEWNRLTELLEFFRGESIGNVSNNDVLKICVNHTYETFETFHVFKEMVEEVGHLKSKNCELEKRVRELEGKEIEKIKKIKTVIVGLTNCID
jgi:hypothetical protein